MLSKKRMFEPLALEDSQRYQESEVYRQRGEKHDAEGEKASRFGLENASTHTSDPPVGDGDDDD